MSKEQKFREELKVKLSDNIDNTSYVDKVAVNIYDAILSTTPKNEQEKLKQTELLHNVNKFIYDFEEKADFRKLLANYTDSKKYDQYNEER